MAKMRTLHDLFIEQLKDMSSAERQLVAALPKMAKSASSSRAEAGVRAAPRRDQVADRAPGPGLRHGRRLRRAARSARAWKACSWKAKRS